MKAAKRKTRMKAAPRRRAVTKSRTPAKSVSKPIAAAAPRPAPPSDIANYWILDQGMWRTVTARGPDEASRDQHMRNRYGALPVILAAGQRVVWSSSATKGVDRLLAAMERIRGLSTKWLTFDATWVYSGYLIKVLSKATGATLGMISYDSGWRGLAFVPSPSISFDGEALLELHSHVAAYQEEHDARLIFKWHRRRAA